MSDLKAQWAFSQAFALWLRAVWVRGYNVSFGHALRCDDCKVGIKASYHKRRLAIDVNLFDGMGRYIENGDAPEWQEVGLLWENLGGTWGGRFRDANHLSWGEGRQEA